MSHLGYGTALFLRFLSQDELWELCPRKPEMDKG